MDDSKPIIIIGNKGPLVIKGGVTLIHPNGLEEQRNKTGAPCSYGLSAKKNLVTALTSDETLGE